MKIYQITFSPTGGTKKVSGILAQGMADETHLIDLCDADADFAQYQFSADDICLVAVPAYGGRVPAPAVSRLSCMKGGGARAVLIAVYGNRAYDDTLLELKGTLEASGFQCQAAVAAIAEHSVMRQFGAQRPDAQDAAELSEFADKIRRKLVPGNSSADSPDTGAGLAVPGAKPYREYHGIPMKPKAGKSCTHCGACAAKCPVKAIPAHDPSKTDETLCISCMRCISVCPSQARGVNKLLLAAGAQKLKKACSTRKRNELIL